MASPRMRASDNATKIKVSGLNMEGKVGPLFEIAHNSRQNVAAVASAPYKSKIPYVIYLYVV